MILGVGEIRVLPLLIETGNLDPLITTVTTNLSVFFSIESIWNKFCVIYKQFINKDLIYLYEITF